MKQSFTQAEEANARARILIADDDPQIGKILRVMLCEDYECRTVGCAEEALALLREEKFELVLSDIRMPGLSGLDMLPRVAELAPETVVVMISAESGIESAIRAMRAGAFDYVTKPFDFYQVEAAVRRALRHHALLETKRRYEHHLEEMVELRTRDLARTNESLRQQIAGRLRAEDRVNYLSFNDPLTGLPNQNFFKRRCERELEAAQRGKRKLAAMFLSVDRFKNIYETLGHEAADGLLCEVGGRLAACVREDDMLAYFGGDEFAFLLKHVNGAEDALKIAGRVREALGPAFGLGGRELFVTASIGISICPDDGADGQTLLKNAAAALHRTRQEGGDNYQFYKAEMNAAALKRLALESDLRRALDREEFTVYYEPQAETEGGRVTGMEALVRWNHPELGLVSPAEFIPLAEDTGLIVPIGEWVLRAACRQARSWHAGGFANLGISVNLSPRQFEQPDLLETVARVLRETGLGGESLELELTESSLMKNAEEAAAVLCRLREMGVKISIDDFGSGYSSLNYLKRLPIDILKIDQSFVREMTTDPKDAAIVKTVITLAHNLNLKVKAEGVETEEQLALLRRLGCDEAQGYLFSRPLPAREFERFLLKRQGFAAAETVALA